MSLSALCKKKMSDDDTSHFNNNQDEEDETPQSPPPPKRKRTVPTKNKPRLVSNNNEDEEPRLEDDENEETPKPKNKPRDVSEEDDDDTSHFDNNPPEDEEEDAQQQPVVPMPTKRKRARSSGSRVPFDAASDPTCVTISAFLNQDDAPHLSHRATFEFNGQQVSIGNMMYTLRRHSRTEEQSEIVQKRLEYLRANPKWVQFEKEARDAKPRHVVVAAPKVPQSPQTTSKQDDDDVAGEQHTVVATSSQKHAGLEGDVWKHAHVILGTCLKYCRMQTEMAELRMLLWQSIPDMRPIIFHFLRADMANHKHKKQRI